MKHLNIAMVIFGLLAIPLGLFCASDLLNETFGPGTPHGYVVALAGLLMVLLPGYDLWRNK